NDVEQQVNMVVRGIDVADQAIDETVVVGDYFSRVAAKDGQLPQVLCKRDGLIELDADVRVENVRLVFQPLENGTAQVIELRMALQSPLRKLRPANQRIKYQTDRRLEKNQKQPALRRFGRAAEGNDNDHRQPHRPFGGEENIHPQRLVEQPCRHRLSLRSDPISRNRWQNVTKDHRSRLRPPSMSNHLAAIIAQYGLLIVFGNVFAEQIGLPVPAIPTLVIAGGLVASGKISGVAVFLIAMIACLIADGAWYLAGRYYGNRVMRSLCFISLT